MRSALAVLWIAAGAGVAAVRNWVLQQARGHTRSRERIEAMKGSGNQLLPAAPSN